jgi:hypothetical protein
MKEAIEGKSEMPQWGGWGNFFVRGLIAFIISLIYLLIPIIVLLVSLGSMAFAIISGAVSNDKTMAVGAIGGAIGGIFISLFLMIIFGFLIPMALAMYIKEDNIGAAFRLGELLSRIRSIFGEYLTVYIVLIVLSFVLGLFAAVPILGIFILILGGFYIEVVGANMFGKVYAKSTP